MGQTVPLFSFIFVLSHSNINFKLQIEKSIDGVLGIQTRAAEWKAQTKPLRYGGLQIGRYGIIQLRPLKLFF